MTGVLEIIGYIDGLMGLLVKCGRSTGSLIASTIATCIGVNIVTEDQYMSLVLPS